MRTPPPPTMMMMTMTTLMKPRPVRTHPPTTGRVAKMARRLRRTHPPTRTTQERTRMWWARTMTSQLTLRRMMTVHPRCCWPPLPTRTACLPRTQPLRWKRRPPRGRNRLHTARLQGNQTLRCCTRGCSLRHPTPGLMDSWRCCRTPPPPPSSKQAPTPPRAWAKHIRRCTSCQPPAATTPTRSNRRTTPSRHGRCGVMRLSTTMVSRSTS